MRRSFAPRTGGGPMLRQTYGGPSSEIALRKAGLIWGGRINPLKARVLPQHVAAMVLFLASDDAALCTGHNYWIDAGWG